MHARSVLYLQYRVRCSFFSSHLTHIRFRIMGHCVRAAPEKIRFYLSRRISPLDQLPSCHPSSPIRVYKGTYPSFPTSIYGYSLFCPKNGSDMFLVNSCRPYYGRFDYADYTPPPPYRYRHPKTVRDVTRRAILTRFHFLRTTAFFFFLVVLAVPRRLPLHPATPTREQAQ